MIYLFDPWIGEEIDEEFEKLRKRVRGESWKERDEMRVWAGEIEPVSKGEMRELKEKKRKEKGNN